MGRLGRRTAVVERRWIGGSCPNIACMPSKNEIRRAEVAHLARHAAEFGTMTGTIVIDMATVVRRKRQTVEDQITIHLQYYKESGAELIMGSGRFIAAKTLEVSLNDGGTRVLTGDRVLELDYLPSLLIVIEGGYSGLELAQAYRRKNLNAFVNENSSHLT
jgi:pyruvate/2-oxoglutarate dehydrogenase complex dihydrolipoamide dehydrogenase (E3) component